MAGIRFLERLRTIQRNPRWRGVEDPVEVLQSVVSHVSKLLNTRQGSTLINEDFGIPDFTSVGISFNRDDIPDMERRIVAFISQYEPRLNDIEVSFLSNDVEAPLQLAFSLNAQLAVAGTEDIPIRLVTRINPLGMVTVSS